MSAPDPAAADRAATAAWLALAQAEAQIGLWQLDVAGGVFEGDALALALWGLPAGPQPLEAVRARLAEPDRARLDAALREPAAIGPALHCTLAAAAQPARRVRLQLRRLDGAQARVLGTIAAAAESADADPQAQLALAADLGRIALWHHDLRTNRFHINAQGQRLLGIAPRPEGLAFDEMRARIDPQDLPRLLAAAEAALHSDEPTDIEVRCRRSDGCWRTVLARRVVQRDAHGRPLAFLGVAIDITERQEAERALRAERDHVAMATRAAGIGTWEFDPATSAAFWDEQMWRLRGLQRPATMADMHERFAHVHPEDREIIRGAMIAAIDDDATQEYEFRVVWPDGQVRWLASRSIALRDEQGQRRRIGANWDVTDRRAAEDALRERERALAQSRAKSQFLARVSHELRTPLNAVLGFAQLLIGEEPAGDAAAGQRLRRLEHIRSAGRHLLALIDDVLDLARIEGGELPLELQPLALAPLVEGSLPLVQPLAQTRRLQLRTGALDQVVLADAKRLRQVLLNLLSNAIKYNREGGTITIDAHAEPGAACGLEVVLRVADSGRGMTEAQLQQLFQPFARLHADAEQIEGTGIGLAIAKTLIEHMGGSITVRSEAGIGSTFEVRLPSAQAAPAAALDAEPAAADGGTAPTPAAPRRRMLYIEDNPINALIIRELVARRPDLELEVAADGAGGVACARRWRPELILLDMQLPDFDGLEVLRQLRAAPETAATPVIALSANAMPADIQRALAAGLADYWTKPLDFKVFTARLEQQFGPAPPPR
ncbi:MAG: ATP-binding protein [Rubrivivax sp.]